MKRAHFLRTVLATPFGLAAVAKSAEAAAPRKVAVMGPAQALRESRDSLLKLVNRTLYRDSGVIVYRAWMSPVPQFSDTVQTQVWVETWEGERIHKTVTISGLVIAMGGGLNELNYQALKRFKEIGRDIAFERLGRDMQAFRDHMQRIRDENPPYYVNPIR